MEFWFLYLIQRMHTPILDQVMRGITFLGNHGWFWCMLAFLLLFTGKTRKTGLTMFLAMAIGAVLGLLILKPLVGRLRPCWIDPSVPLLIAVPQDFSFPSGHTMTAFAAALPLFHGSKKAGIPFLGTGAICLAVLIAFSRMYLFVHFPTDVIGGLVLGVGSAWAAQRMSEKFFLHL